MKRAAAPLAALCGAGLLGAACDAQVFDAVDLGLCEVRGVDPAQEAALGAGDRSHWLQPWRARSETWPARRMREAMRVWVRDVDPRGQDVALLGMAGFAHVGFETQWLDVDAETPTRLNAGKMASLPPQLRAARASGMRPKLLLDAVSVGAAPHTTVRLSVSAGARKGERTLALDRAAASVVVAGRTVLGVAGGEPVLVHALAPDGTATLSRALPADVPAGALEARVLRYAPFSSPRLADGRANPLHAETLRGWTAYAQAVAAAARDTLGDDLFDVQVMSNDSSDVFDLAAFYDGAVPGLAPASRQTIAAAIVEATVTALRQPELRLPNVAISDGARTRRWDLPASAGPAGVWAVERSATSRPTRFGPDAAGIDSGRSLDAFGLPNGSETSAGAWQEAFTPSYEAFFPEVYLTALRSEQLLPDLDDRRAGPSGPTRPELSLSSMRILPGMQGPDAPATAAELRHLATKSALRGLSAYVGKGVAAVYVSHDETPLRLIDDAAADGGAAVRALRAFRDRFAPGEITTPRRLVLAKVGSCASRAQFQGDGTAGRPALLDRDVLAFFPFQIDDRRFVAPTYVMTRSLARAYGGPAGGPTRHDLPAAPFSLTISGVAGKRVSVTAFDPLVGAAVAVEILARGDTEITVRLPLTDSPRLLELAE